MLLLLFVKKIKLNSDSDFLLSTTYRLTANLVRLFVEIRLISNIIVNWLVIEKHPQPLLIPHLHASRVLR